eukprot:CAMPEP_0194085496 /NCGR_PEP_ID=MMETSP0149-20130528/17605_1 /TAXON_ID=122233 /ORGANISM="Chaetoceros debilis, Strain MM31A-1" /LENGTH=496 /DNA_ID=CAMNT_0038768387 /DNA_START=123 /DNA_END=1610 /DNA_ORIENTATION=-
MVFNRRNDTKVQWEKQVQTFRKQKKDQLNEMVRDLPSAISDLSATQHTTGSVTNGSEVDMIGTFGNNGNYTSGDTFTLGDNLNNDFDPIADDIDSGNYHRAGTRNKVTPSGGSYSMSQFTDGTFDEDTYDRMMPTTYSATNDSGFTGDDWGRQGSYHLTGNDTVPTESADGMMAKQRKYEVSKETVNNSYSGDESSQNEESSFVKYAQDFEFAEPPERVSQVMLIYDAILSHPALTILAAPCIPCLAFYVKTHSNSMETRRKKPSKKSRSRKISDDDTFDEYDAQKKRFEDISKNDSRSEINSFDNRNTRDRRPTSRGTEFSMINSKRGSYRGGQSLNSDGMGGQHSQYSNISSQHFGPEQVPLNNYDGYSGASRPFSGYDYSKGFDSATDGAGEFMTNVPQGQWNGSMSGTGNSSHRVGWQMSEGNGSFSTGGFGNQPAMQPQFWNGPGDNGSFSRGSRGHSLGSNTGSFFTGNKMAVQHFNGQGGNYDSDSSRW